MNRTGLIVLIMTSAAVTVAAGEDNERMTASISGTITAAAGRVKAVRALDRDVPQKMTASTVALKTFDGTVDPAAGTFVVAGLPGGKTYDLAIELADGVKIEGVDLRPSAASERALTEADRSSIERLLARLKTHEDEKRILAMAGNGEHVSVLIELLRVRPDHLDLQRREDNRTWRVEIWRYRKPFDGWMAEDQRRVLRRFKTSVATFKEWTWYFEPALGGIDLKPGEARRGFNYALPGALDILPGRRKGERSPAGSRPLEVLDE